jgi:hypothetical protein
VAYNFQTGNNKTKLFMEYESVPQRVSLFVANFRQLYITLPIWILPTFRQPSLDDSIMFPVVTSVEISQSNVVNVLISNTRTICSAALLLSFPSSASSAFMDHALWLVPIQKYS